jgi:hypothetical protein
MLQAGRDRLADLILTDWSAETAWIVHFAFRIVSSSYLMNYILRRLSLIFKIAVHRTQANSWKTMTVAAQTLSIYVYIKGMK